MGKGLMLRIRSIRPLSLAEQESVKMRQYCASSRFYGGPPVRPPIALSLRQRFARKTKRERGVIQDLSVGDHIRTQLPAGIDIEVRDLQVH